jgi:hypothetical protein
MCIVLLKPKIPESIGWITRVTVQSTGISSASIFKINARGPLVTPNKETEGVNIHFVEKVIIGLLPKSVIFMDNASCHSRKRVLVNGV